MISARKKEIIQILQKKSCSIRDIAIMLKVSDRTISREIKAINNDLHNIARIIIKGKCYLEILSSIKFYQLLGQAVPDKINLLYNILINNDLSLDDYAERLFLPKVKIREYITQLNEEYKPIFYIEVKQGKGIVFDCQLDMQIDLMANILNEYPKIVENHRIKQESKAINNYYLVAKRYIDKKEINNQKKACLIINISLYEQDFYFDNKLNTLNRILASSEKIQASIIKIFFNNGFEVPTTHILDMCIQHIIREVIFPTFILKNKSDIKLYLIEQPVAFDVAKIISNYFLKNYSIIINSYYLALYVMLAISTFDDSIYKVIIISHHKSMSSINKYLIEDQIKGVQVYVSDDIRELNRISDRYAVVLDSELVSKKLNNLNVDLIISSLITNTEIIQLKKILRTKTFSKLLQEVADKYTFDMSNTSSKFMNALKELLETLKQKSLISANEAKALIKRERAGNQLVIKNYSLPHIISAEESGFKLLKANLKIPVVINKQTITEILIVIIGAGVTNKSEIFKYLFEIIDAK